MSAGTSPVVDADRVAAWTSRVLASTGATSDTVAPATGEPLVAVPESSAADVADAVERARQAQVSWAATPISERAQVLLRFHDLVLDRQHEILDVIQTESGKARRDAFEEVSDVALTARYYGYAGPENLLPTRRAGLLPLLTKTVEVHHPIGVVGVISPWNYPFTLAVSDALPALLAGNAIVAKPDTQTALSALFGVELLTEAGLPTDVWQSVVGDGATVGGAIVDHADFVCFTGSNEVGRQVARRCGERLIGCTLELGGKNPLIVLDDADAERAAEAAARACFSNAGQLCVASECLYIADAIYDDFVARFLRRVQAMSLGISDDFDVHMGSLIGPERLSAVRAHVDDAADRGARVLAGGRHRPDLGPYVFEPTVLEGVTPQMRCYAEETFGPVVSLFRVAEDTEAIARANDTPFGLCAAVFGREVGRARAVAERLRVGAVTINEGYSAAWGSTDAPMGGMGDSGLGRRHGVQGIRTYTESQTIAVQRLHGVTAGDRLSYETFARAMTRTLRALRKAGRR